MSIASEILRLQTAKAGLRAAIQSKGVPVPAEDTIDAYPPLIAGMRTPSEYEVYATTVGVSEGVTENVASNDLLRIHSTDGHAYTIAEWNALFVENGYSTDGMPTPDGFIITKPDGSQEVIFWSKIYSGQVAQIDGAALLAADSLPHSQSATQVAFTATGSGTDTITGKGWTITEDGDYYVLYTDNTKQSFRIKKGLGYVNALGDSADFAERTEALFQISEWYRHRFAVPSGISTTEADGTIAEVEILNSSGEQGAVNEDMYFWIGGENTGILAKYNLNANHDGTVLMNATQQGNIYNAQKANGVNMNDTGVNSGSFPILVEGSKGAEAIAVDGEWKIITPFVTRPTSMAEAVPDAPAVYFAHSLGASLPSTIAIDMWYQNKLLVNAMVSYLSTIEGRTIQSLPNAAVWCSGRSSAPYAWYVNPSTGLRYSNITYSRYRVAGSSGFIE